MNYALTIKDNIITGVHESLSEFTAKTFANSPGYSEHTIILLDDDKGKYQQGVDLRCYDETGKQKDIVWCIENGYMELPPNTEIINGELVDKEVPAEEQPQTLKQYLEEQFGAVRQETEKATSALKPLMTELVKGKPADIVIQMADFILPWKERDYKLDDVRLWDGQPKRCCQAHDSTGNSTWTPAVASLWAPFHGATPETALPWVAPTGGHDMYKKGEYMVFDGKTYKCKQDTNFSPVDYAQAWEIGTS